MSMPPSKLTESSSGTDRPVQPVGRFVDRLFQVEGDRTGDGARVFNGPGAPSRLARDGHPQA